MTELALRVTEKDAQRLLGTRARRGKGQGAAVIRSRPTGQPKGLSGHRSKYHAQRTTVDGWTFDSKAEAKRYQQLLIRGLAGEIRNLELQPKFWLPHGCGFYRADFRYEERMPELWPGDDYPWADRVEDVKGVRTPLYRLKKKLVEAAYGIQIREVR